MMTTLLWAERRRSQLLTSRPAREQVPTTTADSPTDDHVTYEDVNIEEPATPSNLPARIQRQVGETVLNTMNLARLEEAYNEGAMRVQFPVGEQLEPRHYVYEPRYGGAMRRENPERESLWFSERVTVGDADTLAERFSVMTASQDTPQGHNVDFMYEEDDEAAHATDLADRLVEDWTNLAKAEGTASWKIIHSHDTSDEVTDEPATVSADSGDVTRTVTAAVDDARAQERDEMGDNVSQAKEKVSTDSTGLPLSWPLRFEDQKQRIMTSCFAKRDADGVRKYIH